jgi:acetyl-CoA C-acetyltransferase
MGCVIQAGQGQNVARQASIKAGLPIEVPAVTMNVVCGSGLNCVNQAAQMIMAGDADIVVAGGMENMSMAPYAMPQARFGYRMNNGTLVDTMVNDALWDAFNNYHMIMTADNICREWNLTREELDEFALKSQQKAEAAQAAGAFDAEIVPVMVKKKKELVEFKVDEGPRHGSTIEGMAKLRAINKDGFVTAGNASGINDGAAAMVLASGEMVEKLGLKPMAKLVASCSAGVEAQRMGYGPAVAIPKVLDLAGLKKEDIGYWEINEAFAAQYIACERTLQIPRDKVNRNGSGIAIGHPVGCTGVRIQVGLIHEMIKQDVKYGCASLCVGGGPACAIIWEKC